MVNLMPKRILLIVEGATDEVKFIRALYRDCYKSADYNVYSYKTNIHVLAQELYNNYPKFEEDEIDIKLVLTSLEKDENKKKMLKEKYSDIYLIFDFDPQHDHPHFDTVKRMINYFSDSTANGKLYINYPMMQSYKHFSILPDFSFYNKTVDVDNIPFYKKIVGDESKFTDLEQYDFRTFYSLSVHHLKKTNFILTSKYELPSIDQYFNIDFGKLYEEQLKLYENDNKVWVLNTSIFTLIDFAPSKFFNFVSKHSEELDI